MCEKCFDRCSPSHFPEQIKKGYLARHWGTKSKDGAKGRIEHVFFVLEVYGDDKFWKGVEKIHFIAHRYPIQYRFCYWAKRGKNKRWTWGQFSPYVPKESTKKIIARLKTKEWA